MPTVLQRLSVWFRFRNARPRSVGRQLGGLSLFLAWADSPENSGRFESVLSDPDLAFEALRGYHSFLRARLQSHQLAPPSAGHRDQDAIACLSEIHGRVFKDEIEPLSATKGSGTKVPESPAVQDFASTLQAIFDSAARLVFPEAEGGSSALLSSARLLRVSAVDDSKVVQLKDSYSRLRLMELACVAYAGLAFVDSGANLAVLQSYEEPEDLEEQLSQPDRINLTQRAVKFRARGRLVAVHLSATTLTRLRKFLRIRQELIQAVGADDIAQMFVQCEYSNTRGEPVGIRPLDKSFLSYLRKKVAVVGAALPEVTLRQLRAYKQQELVRRAPVAVVAKLMGHSVPTAVQAYCKAQESVRQGELSAYLDSLQETVLQSMNQPLGCAAEENIPVGACANHGNPSSRDSTPAVQPDCGKTEGCFFCSNYRVHADEEDMRKLLSCRRVLGYIVPTHGDLIRAERVYTAVVDRIDALLAELRRQNPDAYESARKAVEERGQLTRYWAGKLQQLHLLGMLPTA